MIAALPSLQSWQHYPMGPALRRFVGLSEAVGESSIPTAQEKLDFADALSVYLDATATLPEEAVLQELVQMDLPYAVYALSRENPHLALYCGLSAMLLGMWDEAEQAFCEAQRHNPAEPAPYSNLLYMWSCEENWAAMGPWIDTALAACPTHAPIWESVVGYCLREPGMEQLQGYVEKSHSWMGACILTQVDPDMTSEAKEASLARFFHEGERDPDFLIEYTALLGEQERYREIPPIVWQAEKLAKDPLPWQLGFHLAQAYIALGDGALYAQTRGKLLRNPRTPPSIHEMIPEDPFA